MRIFGHIDAPDVRGFCFRFGEQLIVVGHAGGILMGPPLNRDQAWMVEITLDEAIERCPNEDVKWFLQEVRDRL